MRIAFLALFLAQTTLAAENLVCEGTAYRVYSDKDKVVEQASTFAGGNKVTLPYILSEEPKLAALGAHFAKGFIPFDDSLAIAIESQGSKPYNHMILDLQLVSLKDGKITRILAESSAEIHNKASVSFGMRNLDVLNQFLSDGQKFIVADAVIPTAKYIADGKLADGTALTIDGYCEFVETKN